MRTRIHVNQHHIKRNRRDGGDRPVFTVKDYKQNRLGNKVILRGPSILRYTPAAPLKAGAVAYIETHDRVDVL